MLWYASDENEKWTLQRDVSNRTGTAITLGEPVGEGLFGFGCCISEICAKAVFSLSKEKQKEILSMLRTLSAHSDVTVVSGGLPRGVEPSYYAELVRAVNANSLKIVDASGQRMFAAVGEGVDLVKPNIDELETTIGRNVTSKEDMLAGCYELLDRGAKRVLLSLGKQGAVITDGTHNYHCKSINVAVNSTVGAGDGMVAAAAIQLEQGAPLSEILRAGVAAGTATVMTVGKVSFDREKYDDVLSTLTVKEI
jgi:1-phosphofructokinase family hexose kinase